MRICSKPGRIASWLGAEEFNSFPGSKLLAHAVDRGREVLALHVLTSSRGCVQGWNFPISKTKTSRTVGDLTNRDKSCHVLASHVDWRKFTIPLRLKVMQSNSSTRPTPRRTWSL